MSAMEEFIRESVFKISQKSAEEGKDVDWDSLQVKIVDRGGDRFVGFTFSYLGDRR